MEIRPFQTGEVGLTRSVVLCLVVVSTMMGQKKNEGLRRLPQRIIGRRWMTVAFHAKPDNFDFKSANIREKDRVVPC